MPTTSSIDPRQTRSWACGQERTWLRTLLRGIVEVHPLHAWPRGHDAAHRTVGKVEHALDHVAFDGVDHSQSGALRHEIVDVILGQRALQARTHAQQAKKKSSRRIEEPDDWRSYLGHELEQLGDANSNRFRIAQGDVFRREFPDDERGVGHAHRHDDNRKGLAVVCQERHDEQQLPKPLRQRGAAEYSCKRGGGREADLYSGQHARRIVGELECNLGARSPLLHQALQMRAARGDDGKLRHGEQAVQHE